MSTPTVYRAAAGEGDPVEPPDPVLPVVVMPTFLGFGAHTLDIQTLLVSLPDRDLIDLVIGGIPQVLRILDSSYPTAVEQPGGTGQIRLTYAGDVISSGDEFVLGPLDPSLRTDTGGYCGPGYFVVP